MNSLLTKGLILASILALSGVGCSSRPAGIEGVWVQNDLSGTPKVVLRIKSKEIITYKPGSVGFIAGQESITVHGVKFASQFRDPYSIRSSELVIERKDHPDSKILECTYSFSIDHKPDVLTLRRTKGQVGIPPGEYVRSKNE